MNDAISLKCLAVKGVKGQLIRLLLRVLNSSTTDKMNSDAGDFLQAWYGVAAAPPCDSFMFRPKTGYGPADFGRSIWQCDPAVYWFAGCGFISQWLGFPKAVDPLSEEVAETSANEASVVSEMLPTIYAAPRRNFLWKEKKKNASASSIALWVTLYSTEETGTTTENKDFLQDVQDDSNHGGLTKKIVTVFSIPENFKEKASGILLPTGFHQDSKELTASKA